MDKLLLRVLAGMIHNPKAMEFFAHKDYPISIFYDDTGKTPVPHGEKEAIFLAKCATTYYDKHAELATQTYVAKRLSMMTTSKAKIAGYKKLWVEVAKQKKISLGDWKECAESLIHQYREFRHKDLFFQIAEIYEKVCFGQHGQVDNCSECSLRSTCKLMAKSGEEDKSIWIVDWSSAMTEQIKIDTRGTHIRVYEVADMLKGGVEQLKIDADKPPDKKPGIPWAFPSALPTGKLMPGRLYFLVSRTKGGKSAALLQCGNIAAETHPVILFNLEMPVLEELRYRIISYLTGIDFGDIMSNNVPANLMEEMETGVNNWLGGMQGNPDYEIVDIPLQTKLPTIYRHIDNFIARVGRHDVLVIIDYFGLLWTPPGLGTAEKSAYLGGLAKDLHAYARATGCCVLTAHQLNRLAEGVRVLTSKHMRGSDEILDNSDGAWGLLSLSDKFTLLQCLYARYFLKKNVTLLKELHKMGFSEVEKGQGAGAAPELGEEDDFEL
jgi:hypothetical protein